MNNSFYATVYDIVRAIPSGMVTNYGTIARLAGNPRMSRQVGWALHVNPQPGVIPCHRVVNKSGELAGAFAFGGIDAQAELLRLEGVEVVGNRVDMSIYMWRGIC